MDEKTGESADPELRGAQAHADRNLTTFCAAAALNDTGEEMMAPYLQGYILNFLGASPFLYGLLLSLSEGANRILKFFTGAISDRKGRRGPVIGGYICIASYRIGNAFARVWYHLVPTFALRQVGRALRDPAREAAITECFPPEKRGRAFGTLSMVDTLGSVIGPVIGLVLLALFTYGFFSLQEFGFGTQFNDQSAYVKLFVVAAVPTLISALIILLFLKETAKFREGGISAGSGRKKGYFQQLRDGWRSYRGNRKLVNYTYGNMVFSLGAVPVVMILGYLTAEPGRGGLGLSAVQAGLLFIVYSLALCFSSYPCGYLVDRFGRKRTQVAADVLCIAYLVAIALTGEFLMAALAFVLYGVFESLWMTTRRATVADLAPKESCAQALGTFSMMYGLALLFAPLIFGTLWFLFSAQVAALVAAAICLAALIHLLLYC